MHVWALPMDHLEDKKSFATLTKTGKFDQVVHTPGMMTLSTSGNIADHSSPSIGAFSGINSFIYPEV